MIRLVHAELRSMLQNRAIAATAGGAALVAGVSALFASANELVDLLRAEVVVLSLFVLIAGALAGAGEFQHGTVVWTVLAAPKRGVAAVAKVLAAGVVGAVIAAAVLGVTWVVGAVKEGGLPAGTGVGELVAGQLAVGMLTGVFGLTCGLALRNLPVAIGVVFTLALLVPLVFEAKQSLAEEVRFLPYGELSSAALALGSAPATSGPQLELAPGGAVLFGWTALVAALALARFVRQDI